jgi:hypothetical protein
VPAVAFAPAFIWRPQITATPGREPARVTVEYVGGEVRVHAVYKSLPAALLEALDPSKG